MSLQTHSFFLDTTHAAPQGPGSWRFQLREPIDIRQNQLAHVDDITFRNSFPTVDVFSNKLYLITRWEDANGTRPDISGTWQEHEGGSSLAISLTKMSDTSSNTSTVRRPCGGPLLGTTTRHEPLIPSGICWAGTIS